MTFTIRPAVRENTPLIIGIAGPTKSGKTYSAHRLARGLASGGQIVMLNAEGARGHQYADTFKYQACDITAPYSYARYKEALSEIAKTNPACVIIDSVSHAHDGPGGMLDQHEKELDRMAGKDWGKREKCNFAAWIKPKAEETQFIYIMLSMDCPLILCFRAKEKLKIRPGKEPVNLGWQPIASDKISFETIFTLVLPPRSKGVPDVELSEMREPFDALVPMDQPVDEKLGTTLAQWATGGQKIGDDEALARLQDAAKNGTEALQSAWSSLTKETRKAMADRLDALKRTAVEHDSHEGDDLDFGGSAGSSGNGHGETTGDKPMFEYVDVRDAIDRAGKARDDERLSVAEDRIRGTAPQFHAELQQLAQQYRAGWQ